MATNPYQDTQFADSWQQGFAAGFLAPLEEHSPALVLELEQQQVYAEGVLFGRDTSQQGIALPLVEPNEGSFADILEESVDVIHLGHTAIEIAKAATWVAKGAAFASGIIFSFAWIAIFGPDRSLPYFEEAAQQAFLRVRNELSETGMMSENIELFMAACDLRDHGTDQADAMTKQGWWHGSLYLSFEQALAEGRSHGHLENTRVLRFQTAAPDIIDIIELSPTV